LNLNQVQASIIPNIQAECIFASIIVNDRNCRALVDTGSPITVVSANLCQDLEILPYNGSFRSYTGHRLDVLGYTELQIGYKGRNCPIPTVVVRDPQFEMLLGVNWIRKYVSPNHGTWDLDNVEDSVSNTSSPIVDTGEDNDLSSGGEDGDVPSFDGDSREVDVVALVDCSEMIDLQARDPYCIAVKTRDDFIVREGILYKVYAVTTGPSYRIVVPAAMRELIVTQAHDGRLSGHLGVDKTMARIQQSYYWPGIRGSVEKFVGSCPSCQHRNIAKYQLKAPLQILPTVGIFQRIYMDFVICPKSSRGHTSILTIICSTSKFLIAVPMRSQSAIATATALIEHVFLVYGFPSELCSDRGTNFTSDVVRTITHLINVKSVFSSAYSPHSSGQVERVNQTVVDILAKIVDDERVRWSDLLPYAVWAYNSSVHSSTGFSPYQVVFGLVPRDPNLDMAISSEAVPLVSVEDHVRYGFTRIREKVHQSLDVAKARYKKNADKSVRRDQAFSVGESVLIRSHQMGSKFEDRFGGPYRILRIINPASLWVRNDVTSREFSVNVDKCKRYIARTEEPTDFDIVVVETVNQPAVPTAQSPPPSQTPPPICPSAPQRPRTGSFTQSQDPIPSQDPTAPKKKRGDTNPSRVPIDRSPYELRPRDLSALYPEW